ncbi:FAS1-like dehydratase domain-containing protein [Ruegeria sp.]|uniref:FAS1-like dehydratase domain-containing protein n=1 Tax=Ruegeria sp. TaxID=1879320 RepID=UPI003C7C86C2
MPLDTSGWLEREFPSHRIQVTQDQINAFAAAVGESDLSEGPPTFPVFLDFASPEAARRLQTLGIPLPSVLHAEQGFTSHRPVVAGMDLTCSTKLSGLVEKKGGALLLVTFDTQFEDEAGLVAEMVFTLAVRNTQ